MMIFRKEERTFQTPSGWRLATVKEASKHVESIKSQNLLEKWDRARLLDGWIGGSGYEFKAHVAFRSCVGYMLLVPLMSSKPMWGKSPQQAEIQPDDIGSCPYSETILLDDEGRSLVDEKGMSAALFLCCEDWNYDVLCWLLNYWSKSNGSNLTIATDIQPYLLQEIKDTSYRLNKLARHLQSTLLILKMKRKPIKKISRASMRAMTSAIVESVRKNTKDEFLKNKLDDVKLEDIGGQIWYEMELTNDPAKFLLSYFDTRDTLTWESVAYIVWSVVADATAVRIIRSCILEKNKSIHGESLKTGRINDLAFVSSIVVHADRMLDRTFFGYNSLWKEIEKGAEVSGGDYRLFDKMLHGQGYGTFSYEGQHGVLNTVLVQAAKEGEIKLMKRLIECGVRPLDTDDRRQKTALHHAAKLEDESVGAAIAKELLEGTSREKLANAKDYKGRTPLHRAALCGHAHVCRLLLDHKVSVFSEDNHSQIPLHYALHCEPKNEEVIHVLISVDGEENNSQVDWKDDQGITPLDLAVEYEGINMVAWLLSLSRQPEAYFEKLDLALCLRESSAMGYEELVKKLLEARVNPLKRDQEGKTALHYAVQCANQSKALKVARELYKCDMELVKVCDKYGRSVLHIAAFVGHKELCQWLLSIDAVDVDTEDRDGQRALYYAVAGTHDDEELLDVLKGSTNIVDLKDSSGTTPLHVAAAKGKVRMVEKLLSKRLIPKAQDREKFVRAADVIGQTSLHKATSGGHTRVVQILLDRGAHPLNERDCDGKTALHYAAQAEKSGNGENALETVKVLLKKCNFEEKSLLLFASAVAIGSADDSLDSISKLKHYLLKEKGTIKANLLRVAATLGNMDMTRELLTRGANIADIRNKEWIDNMNDNTKKQNVKKVLKQIDNIVDEGTDKPTLQDNLGRIGFANGLAALFLNPFVKSPITVGISGEWGMGKSTVMAQTESILLKTSAYVTFSISWQHENFPGAKKCKLSPKGETKIERIKNSIKQFNQKSDPLNEFLKNYQPQYEKVYKSLAAMDRKDLFEYEDGEEEVTIPSILTVRYNAWKYRNESEAWSSLAVVIAQELEAAMPVAHRLYSSWRYNWKYNKQRIWRDVIFPCLLVVFLALWFTIIVWFLLERAHSENFKDFKYGSFPITLVAIVWAGVKSIMFVVKPITSQMAHYLCLQEHSVNLGYQQQVIEDINFLKDEALSYRPSKWWRAFAWIWCLITFSWDERYVHLETRMPKMTTASKDHLRMVVFIDDLDRCQENVILQILSAINLVLAACKIDVILGMDKSMIERAVRRKFEDKDTYPSESSEDMVDKYLKKIVQLPLDLPDPSHFESRKFLQGQLRMLDTSDTDSDPAPKEKEKMNPKFRIGRRNPNPAQEETRVWGGRERNRSSDMAGDSHLSDKKEQPDTIGESSKCVEGEEVHIVIHEPLADHTAESSNLGEKQGRGVPTSDKGLMTYFRKWRSYLSSLYKYDDNTESKQRPSMKRTNQGKEKPTPGNEGQDKVKPTRGNEDQDKVKPTPVNEGHGKEKLTPENNMPIEMIIPKYTEGEGKVLQNLHTEATGSRKLPREWKRLLNYHRLARNILSNGPNVTKLEGWQVQLIAWIFVCWEWKDQINTVIQKWHKLDVLTNWVTDHQQGEAESSGPSLREIVEEYMNVRWKGDSAKQGRAKRCTIDIHEGNPPEKATTIPMSKDLDVKYIKGVVRDILKEEREQEQGHSLKIKEVEGIEKEELEDRPVMRKDVQEEKEPENSYKEFIRKILAEEKEQEGQQKFREKVCDKGKRIVVSENTAQENFLKLEKENKENTSYIQIGKGMIKVKEAEEEEEKEWEEWIRLRKTLSKYNVSMDGIQAFQNFRFYCVAGYLPWPLPKE